MDTFEFPPPDSAVLAAALAAPFRDEELKWRAGATWEQNGVKFTRPLVYVDVRTVCNRLDAVLGIHGWSSEITPISSGIYCCKITAHALGGVSRMDIGQAGENEAEREKSGVSDAIKRAAVQFGVGRYLYGLEQMPVQMERVGPNWRLPSSWRPHTGSGAPTPLAANNGAARKAKGISLPQINRLQANFNRLGITPDAYLGDRPVSDLTSLEASSLITELESYARQTT